MPPTFQDSGKYATIHASPKGAGDARPTAHAILQDEHVIGALADKIILLTGGSSGIGVEEVRALAATGAKVVFTSRDLAKGHGVRDDILEHWKEQGVQPRIEVIQCDLQSLTSVKRAAEEFKKDNDKLNVLVNNAGIAMTPFKLTQDGFEQQFAVNHLAHFLLFQLLKPLLLAASTPTFNSRVVNVSSSAHHMGSVKVGNYSFEQGGYDPFAGYASSKTCNIWMSNELERRYGSQGLHSTSVHPGGIMTGLLNSHDEQVRPVMDNFIQQENIQRAMKSVEQGAASVVLAAIGKEYEGVGGFYMEDCGVSAALPENAQFGEPGYKPWAYDEEGERRLWLDSLEMLKLNDD